MSNKIPTKQESMSNSLQESNFFSFTNQRSGEGLPAHFGADQDATSQLNLETQKCLNKQTDPTAKDHSVSDQNTKLNNSKESNSFICEALKSSAETDVGIIREFGIFPAKSGLKSIFEANSSGDVSEGFFREELKEEFANVFGNEFKNQQIAQSSGNVSMRSDHGQIVLGNAGTIGASLIKERKLAAGKGPSQMPLESKANTFIATETFGSLTDRQFTRPQTYQHSSLLKRLPREMEEKENYDGDEEEEGDWNVYGSKIPDQLKILSDPSLDPIDSSQKRVIDAIPKILARSPFIPNMQHQEMYSDGSNNKSYERLSEFRPNTMQYQHQFTSPQVNHYKNSSHESWNHVNQQFGHGMSNGMTNSLRDVNRCSGSYRMQEGFAEPNNLTSTVEYDNVRRASHQLSSDLGNRSHDSWNYKYTPPRTKDQPLKKTSVSFMSSESTIDSDNFNNLDQINSSFSTHFSANNSSFYTNSKQNEFNSPAVFDLTYSKQKSSEQREYPRMNLQAQFADSTNSIDIQRVLQEQQHHQRIKSLQQPQQQQQIRYMSSRSSHHNLNQSAILFGNFAPELGQNTNMQGNWNTPNHRMNQSFNFIEPQTHRESIQSGLIHNSSQPLFSQNVILANGISLSNQPTQHPLTQRENPQKSKPVDLGQRIKGRGSKRGDNDDFEIYIPNIEQNPKTTLMIRNIPNKYDQNLLLQTINKNHKGKFDFLYLPIDFKNQCNVGYAFINFIKNVDITAFFLEFNGKKWDKFNSEKIAKINYARIQGFKQLVNHFKTSNVMNQQDKKLKPLVLSTTTRQGGNEMIQNIQSIEELIKQQKATLNTN